MLILTVIAATAAPLSAQQFTPGVRYSVEFPDAVNHYITVRMSTMPVGAKTVLMMPVWTPGSYLVREYARHVDRMVATSDSGDPLIVRKISKNRWEVDTPQPDSGFSVEYRIYCHELSVRSNHVERGYAVLNGAATFVTVPERMGEAHQVSLILPKHWPRSASSLKTEAGEPETYLAGHYDELVDSPIVAGNVQLFPFKVADVPHFLVLVNDRGNWDGEKAARDLAQLVESHHRVWNCVPYERYYFINVIDDGGGGGLEHDHSCLMIAGQHTMRSDDSYEGWLSLCSHEFFHVWNVRRLRPRELVRYDYESEIYTPNLWIAEGLTTYYEDLVLARAGLIETPDLISSLGNQIRRLQMSEGRKLQSLRDSSHDAWIKFYRPADNSDSTQISYYNKGAVVGLLLDTRIRAATQGEASLDQVLQILYQRHAGQTGYVPEDFTAICSEVARTDLAPWLHHAVDTTEELDYQELADWFGLQVGDILPANAEPRPDAGNDEDRKPRWIGIGEADSPATKAGISTTDELIAINDIRLDDNLSSQLQQFEVGDPIKILIAREGRIEEVLLTVGAKPAAPSWNLRTWRRASAEQKAHLAAWATWPDATDEASPGTDETTGEEIEPPALEESPESIPVEPVGDGQSK